MRACVYQLFFVILQPFMEQKQTKNKKSRSGIWFIIVAALVLEAISCTMYFTSRHSIRVEANKRAETELRKAELEIELHTIEVETVAKALAIFLQKHLDQPDAAYAATRLAVRALRENTSLAVAFVPNYYPSKGTYYEICSSRFSEDSIYTRNIGSAEHDYTQMEWYQNGFVHDSCWWCEPYMDDSGSEAFVVSCSYPVRDKSGKVVAVVCVDLSLTYLRTLSENLQVYPNSVSRILSSKGHDIVRAPDTIAGKKYNYFHEEIDATGWHIEIRIPEEELFRGLNFIGRIVGLMMLIGLLLLGAMVWHTTRTVRQLIATREQNQRMESELEIAKTIQMSMIPKNVSQANLAPSTDIWGFLRPAKEIGGDLYDFYERDGKLFFCIGDVAGKGVPAALVMATICSHFRNISAHEEQPERIVRKINRAFVDRNEQNMFVTFFLGIQDLENGELRFCNAGHNAPVLMANGEWRMVDVLPNLPLGIDADFIFEAQSTTLLRGDTLFLYTDGLNEAENDRHEQFGEQRMMERLRQKTENGKDEGGVHALLDDMCEGVETFVDGAEQSDDLTMLAIRWMKYSLIMRNDIQQIPTLAEWVETLPVPAELNMPINLALEEAVTNVMLYAYPDGPGRVLVEFTPPMTFTITDSGIPFDPTKKEDADISLSAEERPIGGLGIFLVRQIMDEVTYERKDNKNILTLVKNL